MLPHNLWKIKIQITASCAPNGRLVELLWCPSASQSLASGTSSLSVRGWRSTAAITKLSPSVGWVVDEIKANTTLHMFVLPYQVVYSLCEMSLSELLWHNQFESFQPPHPDQAEPNEPPGSATDSPAMRFSISSFLCSLIVIYDSAMCLHSSAVLCCYIRGNSS